MCALPRRFQMFKVKPLQKSPVCTDMGNRHVAETGRDKRRAHKVSE